MVTSNSYSKLSSSTLAEEDLQYLHFQIQVLEALEEYWAKQCLSNSRPQVLQSSWRMIHLTTRSLILGSNNRWHNKHVDLELGALWQEVALQCQVLCSHQFLLMDSGKIDPTKTHQKWEDVRVFSKKKRTMPPSWGNELLIWNWKITSWSRRVVVSLPIL